jgi:hypothetical protein
LQRSHLDFLLKKVVTKRVINIKLIFEFTFIDDGIRFVAISVLSFIVVQSGHLSWFTNMCALRLKRSYVMISVSMYISSSPDLLRKHVNVNTLHFLDAGGNVFKCKIECQ